METEHNAECSAMAEHDGVDRPRVNVGFTGRRRGYNLPRLLNRAGLLNAFYTDIFLGNKPWLRAILDRVPARLAFPGLAKLRSRQASNLPPDKVISFDTFGVKSVLLRDRAKSWRQLQQYYALINREFCERVVRSGFNGATAFYGMKGACLEVFEDAKRRGTICIMDQNSAPQRVEAELLNREIERWGGWETRPKIELIFPDADPIREREQTEWELADIIVCPPSEFIASALRSMGVSGEKCRVLPPVLDVQSFAPVGEKNRGNGLNVLFVGYVSIRKGVPYLLEALRKLNSENFKCRLVGRVNLDSHKLAEYGRWIEVVGQVPGSQIGEHFRWADVMVFPSVSEAFALATCEALASGVPVIATPNSGSMVVHGEDGFIVPLGDSDAIAEQLERLFAEPDLLAHMSRSAVSRSRNFSLETYGSQMIELIQSIHHCNLN